MKFTKEHRLLKRGQFLKVKNQGCTQLGVYILLQRNVVPCEMGTKLGITVTRKFGKAHERNRFKRLVREAFRLSYLELPQDLELVVKPRAKAKCAEFKEIQKELLALAKKN